MKQSAVEKLVAHLIEYGFDLSAHKLEIEQAKEMEKQHKEYSEEEVKKLIKNFLLERGIGRELQNVNEWLKQFKNK